MKSNSKDKGESKAPFRGLGVISKILVANRGEIACRIFSTAAEMGIKTVAVFSDADKDSLHVKIADEAVNIGGTHAAESYLVQDKIIAAAKQTGADAIHPGYGFLSENASFAKRCKEEEIIFVGPSHTAIEKLGSKSAAKELMRKAGVPVVPGYNGDDQNFARFQYEAEEIGFPVLLKASAGGGGKGMRIVNNNKELKEAFEAAQREAVKSFGDGNLLMEKYFPKAKHIEFQIFGDEHGNYIHLGERECSLQRRYQKVIEEAPSPSLTAELRDEMGKAAVAAAKAATYTNAGTVEFLFSPADSSYYFLEVNTRLQVEHPVTEMVTMLDLVRLQIMVAEGQHLPAYMQHIETVGMHSIECRICAEDAANSFFPSTGEILFWQEPDLDSVRVDSGVETSSKVGVFYDSMLAKLIVVEENRTQAIRLMNRALERLTVLGITTNKDFLQQLLQHPKFVDGSFDTKLIERDFSDYKNIPSQTVLYEMAIAAMLYDWKLRKDSEPHTRSLNGWRNVFYEPQKFELLFAEEKLNLTYRYLQNSQFDVSIGEARLVVELVFTDRNFLVVQINNVRQRFLVAQNEYTFFVQHPLAGTFSLTGVQRFAEANLLTSKGGYTAPMPGEIVKVLVKAGDKVKSGKGLLVMSSMKMETTIEAHSDGEVEEIFVAEKNFVEAGTSLLKMKTTEA